MKHYLHILVLGLFLMIGLGFASAGVSSAATADLFPASACNGNTTICPDSSGDGIFSVIKTVINVLLSVAGVVAVIMIIIGGIRYITSNGEQSHVKAAKDTILYAIVGLVVTIVSFSIVNFVVGKL